MAAEPLEAALLEHAQQLGLRDQRHVADLVEEQRAVVGQLEASRLAIVRAGERAFLVAEDFRLEQRVGQRRAVDRLELGDAAAAQLVDHPRDDFLARAGRSEDQHRDVRLGGGADPLEDDQHLLVAADHLAEALHRRRLILGADGGAAFEERGRAARRPRRWPAARRCSAAACCRRQRRATPKSTSSRTQFSTSSRRRPNVCISDSTSNALVGPWRSDSGGGRRAAATARACGIADPRSPARPFAVAAALARRALKVRSSMRLMRLSAGRRTGDRAGRAAPVVVGLIALDQVLHPRGVALAVAVAADRARRRRWSRSARRTAARRCRSSPTRCAPCESSLPAGRSTAACTGRRWSA